jgi:hypothetical protein
VEDHLKSTKTTEKDKKNMHEMLERSAMYKE